jgi:hypothetical protein
MLKLEVREAARVIFPSPETQWNKSTMQDVREAVAEMRHWRHYI